MTSSSAPPPPSHVAQAPRETVQPPSGAVHEPGNQPATGTELPASPHSTGDLAQTPEGAPPSGEVEERAVPRPGPSGIAGNIPPPRYVGPTDNLTKVANAIEVRHKSLTTLVVVAPGLALTQPVTISIALGGHCPTRITQTYVASIGNHFLYNDCEGDGKPRNGLVNITLTEPNPQGGVYDFPLPWNVMLDPLYDVTTSWFQFTLLNTCNLVGDTEIDFYWWSPDKQEHKNTFHSVGGRETRITQFAWTRTEVSASANLVNPSQFYFRTVNTIDCCAGFSAFGPTFSNLVPGKTQTFKGGGDSRQRKRLPRGLSIHGHVPTPVVPVFVRRCTGTMRERKGFTNNRIF